MQDIKPQALMDFLYNRGYQKKQPPDILAHLPLYSVAGLTLSGVYFLIKDDEVVYIGQSTNVQSRISTGHKDKEYDEAFMLLIPEEYLQEVETAFIAALNPIYNRTSLPKGRQKNARVLQILDIFGWEID